MTVQKVCKVILFGIFLFSQGLLMAQSGHLLPGLGAKNLSMGGAATGQPIDISGALLWNPAGITAFNENTFRFDFGMITSTGSELNASVPVLDSLGNPVGVFSGSTDSGDPGFLPFPSVAAVWANEDSRHTWGASLSATSGLRNTFPEDLTNPILLPQALGGFGEVDVSYAIIQLGITWAYELTDHLSIGVQPILNYGILNFKPNATSAPSLTAGYPETDEASKKIGFGAAIGAFYDSGTGFKAGISYKTVQSFSSFEFDNTFSDGTTGTSAFDLDFPPILSLGLGYSTDAFDLALDYRYVFFENTNGFTKDGFTSVASISGFGWNNIHMLSLGVQYKGIDRFPIRLGYVYNTNPVEEDLAFFSSVAPAVIQHGIDLGFGYELSDRVTLDGAFHVGFSDGMTSGPILIPGLVAASPPYGAVPGSEVSYKTRSTIASIGINYLFSKQ